MFQATTLPRVLCKKIGVFLGTDISLLPGQTFTRVSKLNNPHPGEFIKGCYAHVNNGFIYTLEGFQVQQFQVKRVTPCTASAILICEHRILKIKGNRCKWTCFKVEKPTAYNYKEGTHLPIEKTFGTRFDSATREKNQIIPQAIKNVMTNVWGIGSFRTILYDAPQGCFCVIDFKHNIYDF